MKTVRRMAGWILFGALALGVAAAAQQQQQQPQQQQPQQPGFTVGQAQPTPEEAAAVQQIMQTADLDQRLTLIQDFLAKYPNSQYVDRAYAAAADAYRKKNKYAQAIEYGEKAVELRPTDAYSMIIVADSLAESAVPGQVDYKDRLSRAENYCRRSLDVLTQLQTAMQNRTDVQPQQLADVRRAEALTRAILGYVHLRRQENAQAIDELNKAIATDGYRADTLDYHRLGLAYKRQGQLKEAESAFQKCVESSGGGFAECQKQLDAVRQSLGSSAATEKKP